MNVSTYTFEVYDERLNRAYQFKSFNAIRPIFAYTKPEDRHGLFVRVYCYYDMIHEITLDEYLSSEISLSELLART
jgi:hypothetical protein